MEYKISVCVPIYNVEKYFEQCLESLFTQTMLDGVEFIFVNDCTPDSSMTILQRTLQKYPALREQVVIYNHEQNRGLAAVRNTALELSHGEYIIHVDSDDWVEPNYLEELYTTITENDADIAICNYFGHGPKGEFGVSDFSYLELQKATAHRLINLLFNYEVIPMLWIKLVRTELYKKNKILWIEGINKGEDMITSLKIFFFCKKCSFTKVPLYHYRYANGFTKNMPLLKNISQDIQSVLEIERFFKEQGTYFQYEKEIIRKKACIRLDYLFANPKCSIKKYTEVFSDVPLSCLKFTSKKISKFRELFFKIVDHKLYLFANIYLFFYSIFRFFKRGV